MSDKQKRRGGAAILLTCIILAGCGQEKGEEVKKAIENYGKEGGA